MTAIEFPGLILSAVSSQLKTNVCVNNKILGLGKKRARRPTGKKGTAVLAVKMVFFLRASRPVGRASTAMAVVAIV